MKPEIVSTHVCKTKDVGVHGNLFGGDLLAWLDESGAAFAAQCIDSPRLVTVRLSEVVSVSYTHLTLPTILLV